MFIFPKENVSFREGNPLCAGCKMPDYAANAIYKVHFKTSKISHIQLVNANTLGKK